MRKSKAIGGKTNSKEYKMILERINGKQLPILVLDERWHKLFQDDKPREVSDIEDELNELLKEQGRLVNSIKSLKAGKKKLMGAIVAGMNESNSDKKKNKQQKLLLETTERIQKESDLLMDLPYKIRETNEKLLVVGLKYCYDNLQIKSEELENLTAEIEVRREELKAKVLRKTDLEEWLDVMYSEMHTLVGHEVMDLFDKT
ncbi:hypothetical protein [Eubacterium xylanophilum]|uniref:hypothetical protein n=1 Tax=Eubacterium xylanophilum TaxID=39497 RepID=UPI00047E05F2|nr:hypothetical protein [Eubacterium xylanophilum]